MIIREATFEDLPIIVKMLADDVLGKDRERFEDPLPDSYVKAFETIDRDPTHHLYVMENDEHELVGTFQLNFLQHLAYQGGIRAQLEQVRVKSDQTGHGYGRKMMEWAIDKAKEEGAHIIQLTSTKVRKDAIRFYEKLGFKATHEGMKIYF